MVKINGWKLTAIIFIILFILETSLLIWAINSNLNDFENENICSLEVCPSNSYIIYDSYYYEQWTKICECNINKELINNKYIRKLFINKRNKQLTVPLSKKEIKAIDPSIKFDKNLFVSLTIFNKKKVKKNG